MNQKTTANTRYKQAGQLASFENSLCLIYLFLTERIRIFNPSLRVARERYLPFYSNVTKKIRKNFVTLQRLLTTIFINEVHNHK